MSCDVALALLHTSMNTHWTGNRIFKINPHDNNPTLSYQCIRFRKLKMIHNRYVYSGTKITSWNSQSVDSTRKLCSSILNESHIKNNELYIFGPFRYNFNIYYMFMLFIRSLRASHLCAEKSPLDQQHTVFLYIKVWFSIVNGMRADTLTTHTQHHTNKCPCFRSIK